MDPSTKGYSPEQVATGALENGEKVTILYVKEFLEQLRHVNKIGQVGYFYSWSYMEDTDSYVLFIYWENETEIAIVFPPKQHTVVEQLKEPQNLIVTGIPINVMVQKAESEGKGFLDLEDSVFIRNVKVKEGLREFN